MNERQTDERVAAVRADKLIGDGSLTNMDERSDGGVQAELDELGITDPKQAVLHFIESEGEHQLMLAAREGNDERMYNEWRRRMKAHVLTLCPNLDPKQWPDWAGAGGTD